MGRTARLRPVIDCPSAPATAARVTSADHDTRPTPGRSSAPGPIVVFLARDGRADRLLAEHVDDGDGRCRVCPAGPQAGRTRWPCLIADYAEEARRLAARSAGHPPAGDLTPAAPRPSR